jgi:antitoxin HicB
MSTAAAGTANRSGRAADVRHYSMVIVWSDEDQAFLVHLPEWERGENVFGPVTHAETYEEAAKNGQEALASLIASWQDLGWELPAPRHSGTFVLVERSLGEESAFPVSEDMLLARLQGTFTTAPEDESTEAKRAISPDEE